MTSARDAILGAVSRALPGDAAARQARVQARLAAPPDAVVPARGTVGGGEAIHAFKIWAERADATVEDVTTSHGVPAAVARYLAAHDIAPELRAAGELRGLAWEGEVDLTVTFGPARDGDTVGVVAAFAGVAETGTLVMLSGADSPSTLNFLSETLIAVIGAGHIVGGYEAAWARVAEATGGALPRTVNWITGPSRTADIEQQIMLGVHGPRRLHILVVGRG
jgi:L-lactate dehydrogenase complex protein LldG